MASCTKEIHYYGSSQATIRHSCVHRNNAELLSSHPTKQNDLSTAVKKKTFTYKDVDFKLAPPKGLNLNISLIEKKAKKRRTFHETKPNSDLGRPKSS